MGFPDGVKLDLDKLIVGGHSFGGITCLDTVKKDGRFKGCLTLDPCVFPEDEWDKFSGDFSNLSGCAVHWIMSGTFLDHVAGAKEQFGHDAIEAQNQYIAKFADGKRLEVMFMLNTGHVNQVDLGYLNQVPLRCIQPPPGTMIGPLGWSNKETMVKLLGIAWLQIQFLHKNGLDSGFADLKAVENALEKN